MLIKIFITIAIDSFTQLCDPVFVGRCQPGKREETVTMYEQYQDTLTDALWSDIARGSGETVAVSGDTYRHRKTIAALGGKWNAARKVWDVPVSQVSAVRALRGVVVA